jgi:GNAT superfamily N-acetyltransferase
VGAHEIVISADDRPGREELVELYDAVGWTAYTTDPDVLLAAVDGSTRVVTARYGDDLLGLARVVSDGASIAYLQDVLVRPELQREGVGRQLVQAALEPFAHVRQKVLLTDDEPGQRSFYESLGYTELRDHGDGRLRAFVRFEGIPADPYPDGASDGASDGVAPVKSG